MQRIVNLSVALSIAALSACSPQPQSTTPSTVSNTSTAAANERAAAELNWARAALERNPDFKVLAVDAAKNTIQVRVKASGETMSLSPGELAAIPISDLVARASSRDNSESPSTSAPTSLASNNAPATEEILATPKENPKPEYRVEREDGRVRVTGPGVSIESNRAASSTQTADKKFDEPIICDGKRMLHLDNRRINVDGDAITVRGGCELHITNSRINATGTAVTVLDATLHLSNSEVTGKEGSLTTSSAARVYLRGNTFNGLARRDAQSSLQDQGGNTWR